MAFRSRDVVLPMMTSITEVNSSSCKSLVALKHAGLLGSRRRVDFANLSSLREYVPKES